MNCAECNGNMISRIGPVKVDSRSLGTVLVPNIRHRLCKSCGDVLIDIKFNDKVVSYVKEKEREAISGLPVGNFISANDAAKVLGITKQAFSKNPKIKRGLIYSVTIDGRKLYDVKSVEQFKNTGNGKYRIATTSNRDKIVDTWKTKLPKSDSFRIWSIDIGGTSRQYTIRRSERRSAYKSQPFITTGKNKIMGFRDFN